MVLVGGDNGSGGGGGCNGAGDCGGGDDGGGGGCGPKVKFPCKSNTSIATADTSTTIINHRSDQTRPD